MAGFERNNVLEHRKELEKQFTKWVAKDNNRVEEYANTLGRMNEAYQKGRIL